MRPSRSFMTVFPILLLNLALGNGFAQDREDDVSVDETPAEINVVFGLDPGKGNYDGVTGEPDDTWNLLDVGQRSIPGLRSAQGSATPVKLSVSENDGEWGIPGHSGIFHAYIYHNSQSVDLKATFDGLSPGLYRIYVYAHGDAPNQNAEVELLIGEESQGSKRTLNDGTMDFRAETLEEGVQFVSFEIAVTDESPINIISKRDGSGYSMFNAIQIVRVMR